MDVEEGPGPRTALRSIVLGFRVLCVPWVAVLAAFAVANDRTTVGFAGTVVATATVWAGATLLIAQRGDTLRHPLWLAADAVVSAGLVAIPYLVEPTAPQLSGGYPFSTVLLAAWARGPVVAVASGLLMAGATFYRAVLRPGVDVAVVSIEALVLYLASAGALAWGIRVLLDADDRRRTADAARADAQRALDAERAERLIAQERAETAAHLHDSVLQTLALIQRRADVPGEVTQLARAQERDLRGWLFSDGGSSAATGLVAGVRAAAEEVEATFGTRVEVVAVGDAHGEHLEPLVAAAREAMINAARHAGAPVVQVYVEGAPQASTIFVRDRGAGFDPDDIPGDRRGVRDSIVGRMQRHGGSAAVRSSPGSGTEVELTLPRSDSLEG